MITRDEILAMDPGRQLEALVAEKVMGFEVYKDTDCFDIMGIKDERKGWVILRYSTDMSAAWQVQEKLQQHGGMELGCYGAKNGARWYVAKTMVEAKVYEVTCDTAPEAICKLALLAVMDA